MIMQNAPGVGNTIGDQYQIWLGISIIKDWIIEKKHLKENNDLWLKEEYVLKIVNYVSAARIFRFLSFNLSI